MDCHGLLSIHSHLPHKQQQQSYGHRLHTASYAVSLTPPYLEIAPAYSQHNHQSLNDFPLSQLQQSIHKHQLHQQQRQQTPSLAKFRVSRASAATASSSSAGMDWSAETEREPHELDGEATAAAVRVEASTILDVDVLMRIAQAKPLISSSSSNSGSGDASEASIRGGNQKKRYECYIGECRKTFFHMEHLEIHIRAHTGEKPYTYTYPTYTSAFSQPSNSKTHRRCHTGERLSACRICDKSFNHRGSLRANAAVHNTKEAAKSYACRLDECRKPFTHWGNLKSHTNESHQRISRELKERLAAANALGGGNSSYSDANKGINGRKVGSSFSSLSSAPSAGLPALSTSCLSSSLLCYSSSEMNVNLGLGRGLETRAGVGIGGVNGIDMEIGMAMGMELVMDENGRGDEYEEGQIHTFADRMLIEDWDLTCSGATTTSLQETPLLGLVTEYDWPS